MSTTGDDVLANTLLAMKAIRDARRIIMVPPALEDQARAAVAASPWPGLLEVIADPACPPDQIFIIATHAWEGPADA